MWAYYITLHRLNWMGDLKQTNKSFGVSEIYSLAPGICVNNFKNVIFQLMFLIEFASTSCEIALRYFPQNPINDKSTWFM